MYPLNEFAWFACAPLQFIRLGYGRPGVCNEDSLEKLLYHNLRLLATSNTSKKMAKKVHIIISFTIMQMNIIICMWIMQSKEDNDAGCENLIIISCYWWSGDATEQHLCLQRRYILGELGQNYGCRCPCSLRCWIINSPAICRIDRSLFCTSKEFNYLAIVEKWQKMLMYFPDQ